MSTVNIIVTRPTYLDGVALAIGQVLELSPLEAAELLRNGKAELVTPADEPAVRAAMHAQVARQCATTGGMHRGGFGP